MEAEHLFLNVSRCCRLADKQQCRKKACKKKQKPSFPFSVEHFQNLLFLSDSSEYFPERRFMQNISRRFWTFSLRRLYFPCSPRRCPPSGCDTLPTMPSLSGHKEVFMKIQQNPFLFPYAAVGSMSYRFHYGASAAYFRYHGKNPDLFLIVCLRTGCSIRQTTGIISSPPILHLFFLFFPRQRAARPSKTSRLSSIIFSTMLRKTWAGILRGTGKSSFIQRLFDLHFDRCGSGAYRGHGLQRRLTRDCLSYYILIEESFSPPL